jgi:hypothetical protein
MKNLPIPLRRPLSMLKVYEASGKMRTRLNPENRQIIRKLHDIEKLNEQLRK